MPLADEDRRHRLEEVHRLASEEVHRAAALEREERGRRHSRGRADRRSGAPPRSAPPVPADRPRTPDRGSPAGASRRRSRSIGNGPGCGRRGSGGARAIRRARAIDRTRAAVADLEVPAEGSRQIDQPIDPARIAAICKQRDSPPPPGSGTRPADPAAPLIDDEEVRLRPADPTGEQGATGDDALGTNPEAGRAQEPVKGCQHHETGERAPRRVSADDRRQDREGDRAGDRQGARERTLADRPSRPVGPNANAAGRSTDPSRRAGRGVVGCRTRLCLHARSVARHRLMPQQVPSACPVLLAHGPMGFNTRKRRPVHPCLVDRSRK